MLSPGRSVDSTARECATRMDSGSRGTEHGKTGSAPGTERVPQDSPFDRTTIGLEVPLTTVTRRSPHASTTQMEPSTIQTALDASTPIRRCRPRLRPRPKGSTLLELQAIRTLREGLRECETGRRGRSHLPYRDRSRRPRADE